MTWRRHAPVEPERGDVVAPVAAPPERRIALTVDEANWPLIDASIARLQGIVLGAGIGFNIYLRGQHLEFADIHEVVLAARAWQSERSSSSSASDDAP